METFLRVLAILALTGGIYGENVSQNMRSFSSAIKGGSLGANEEKVLYEHNTGQPGVITEQWFTGKTDEWPAATLTWS